MNGYAAGRARAADLNADDHRPACPRCGDLAPPSATFCDACGDPLLPTPLDLELARSVGSAVVHADARGAEDPSAPREKG